MAWYDDVAPARQTFACGRAAHEIVWERGRLGLLAHGAIDAERTLVALGSKAPGCLSFVDEWKDALHEPFFLDEWARLERPERLRLQRYEQLWRDRVINDDDRLAPLAHFSDAMLDRLAFAVVQRHLRRGDDPDETIERATAARVRRALVRSLVAAGLRGGLAALVRMSCSAGTTAAASGVVSPARRSAVEVAVPRAWLIDVYARGLAFAGDHLVLSAEPCERAGRARVTVVVWDAAPGGLRARTEPAVACRTAPGRWSLTRKAAPHS